MAMPQVHIVALCVERGFGLGIGAQVLSVMLFSGMISRIGFGYLSDKIGPVYTLFIGSFLQMLSLVFFLPFDSQLSLYIVSLMFGLSQGGIVAAYGMIIRKYLPIEAVGERVGLVIMATIVGMGLGGWMSGEIFDLTQSYKLAFVNGIFWNFTNLLIMNECRRPLLILIFLFKNFFVIFCIFLLKRKLNDKEELSFFKFFFKFFMSFWR